VHYYQHNIGDYARDTGHLSVLEHGIYRLLLDWCYLNEKPITTEQAIRIARGNPVETQSVLSEFFQPTDHGWTHKRVQREVSQYHGKAEKNRQNGAKGGRPKANDNPLGYQTDANWMPTVTLTKNQEPITNNQEPSIDASQGSAKKRGSRLPDDWRLPKSWGEWSMKEFPAWSAETVRAEADKFKDFWISKAGKDGAKLNWEATWRNWCRNAKPSEANSSKTNPFAGAI